MNRRDLLERANVDALKMEETTRQIYATAEGLAEIVWFRIHDQVAELRAEIMRAVKAEGCGE